MGHERLFDCGFVVEGGGIDSFATNFDDAVAFTVGDGVARVLV